jgi:hypothetical protein
MSLCVARENTTYLTGMMKSNVTLNVTLEPQMEEIFNTTAIGLCFAILNGNYTSTSCSANQGFLCEEL